MSDLAKHPAFDNTQLRALLVIYAGDETKQMGVVAAYIERLEQCDDRTQLENKRLKLAKNWLAEKNAEFE